MKVIARHQLYLDYVLPRSTDWPDKPINFTYLDVEAFVRPRMHDEPLFPTDVDKDLFEMRVPFSKAEPYVTGEGYFLVREKCLDRIEVDIHFFVNNYDAILNEETHEYALNAAIDAANIFLSHCRVVARDSFIRGIERHYSLETGKFFTMNPRTICWYEGENGTPIPAYEGGKTCSAHSGSMPLAVTKPVSMQRVVNSIKASEYPSLPMSLLADAAWQLRTLRLREALLLIGTACEVAGHSYLRTISPDTSIDPDKLVPNHVSFAEKWFHHIPMHFQSRSFWESFPNQFELVKRMYWSRNKIAHEGRAYYRDPEDNSEIRVTQKIATEFLFAAQDSIDWLLELGNFSKNDDA